MLYLNLAWHSIYYKFDQNNIACVIQAMFTSCHIDHIRFVELWFYVTTLILNYLEINRIRMEILSRLLNARIAQTIITENMLSIVNEELRRLLIAKTHKSWIVEIPLTLILVGNIVRMIDGQIHFNFVWNSFNKISISIDRITFRL
jgi:hypothetical protein